MRIALLYEARPEVHPGGPPDLYLEFERLETIQLTALALERLGHSVVLIDACDRPILRLAELRNEIELVFNISVGFGTRFRELMPAAMCESLQLRYTGSDPMAQALAANKHATKLLAREVGIATPHWCFVRTREDVDRVFGLPAERILVKPNYEGTSIGIAGPVALVDRDAVRSAVDRVMISYRQPVVVETFIAGYDATVPILGNPGVALAALRLSTGETVDADLIFNSDAKEDSELAWAWTREHPPRFHEGVTRLLADAARTVHELLGCRDISRVDFRVDEEGNPFLLEVNATPQLAPRGGAFEAALNQPFEIIVGRVIDVAMAR
jgi:D-alanine-D-alanine ligase